MERIILLGYMGAGKTTVGKALAKHLGLQFYDLDWYLEERFHQRIPEIFARQGEAGFRDIERRILHEAAEFEDIVLSCGGGTPCFFDNMDYMNRQGTTIFLDASPQTIVAHLRLSHTVRPLLQEKTGDDLLRHIEAQLDARRPYYEKAQYAFNVDILSDYSKIDLLVNHIVEALVAHKDGKMEN